MADFSVVKTALQTLSATLFFATSWILLKKSVRSEYKRPTVMFGLWWLIGGLLISANIVRDALLDNGISIRIPLLYSSWVLLPLALFFMLNYTIFLFTGSEKRIVPLAVIYSAAIAALVTIGTVGGPYLDSGGAVAYSNEHLIGYLSLIVTSVVALPQIAVCIALYSLVSRLGAPTQKYRTVMLSTGILLWVFSTFIATVIGKIDNPLWPLVTYGILVLTGIMAYCAYNPPAFLKRRYGLASISDEKSRENPQIESILS